MRVHVLAPVFACAFASVVHAGYTGGPGTLTPIAYERQQVPGLGSAVYAGFGTSAISSSGHVSFQALIAASPGGSSTTAVMHRTSEGLTTLVAHPSLAPVPGVPSQQQGDYLRVLGLADAVVSFSSSPAGFGSFRYVNAGPPSSPSAVAGIGAPVQGLAGSTHTGSFFDIFQGPGGHTGFLGDFTGTDSGRALWHWSPVAGLEPALLHNQPVSSSVPGVHANLFDNSRPFAHMSADGTVATGVSLTGPGVTSLTNYAAVRGTPGEMSIIARRGSRPAPGSNLTWWTPGVTSVSPAGYVGIVGTVYVDGVSGAKSSLWVTPKDGSPELVAIADTPLPPGGGAPALQMRNFSQLTVNSSGQFASVVATNQPSQAFRLGVLAGTPGDMRTIFHQGAQIPGMPAGSAFVEGELIRSLHLSEQGTLAFLAVFTDGSVESRGVWASDLLGNLRLVARTGQTLQLAPGDVRTVEELFMEATPAAISANDTLIFSARFTDGSRAIMSVQVPGPASGLIGLVAGLTIASRRRR